MAVFEFSESVSLYLRDPKLRSAIEDLAKEKMLSGFDAAFEWEDFPDFVDAWVSAQKVVGDWSKDFYRLWDETWGAVLAAPIPYSSRDQAIEHLCDAGIYEAWLEEWYSRSILYQGQCVNLVIFKEEREIGKKESQSCFRLQVELPKKPKRGFKILDWEQDDNVFNGRFYPLSTRDVRTTLELDAIREEARTALKYLGIATDDNYRV